mgnify:CR=1 FL=1
MLCSFPFLYICGVLFLVLSLHHQPSSDLDKKPLKMLATATAIGSTLPWGPDDISLIPSSLPLSFPPVIPKSSVSTAVITMGSWSARRSLPLSLPTPCRRARWEVIKFIVNHQQSLARCRELAAAVPKEDRPKGGLELVRCCESHVLPAEDSDDQPVRHCRSVLERLVIDNEYTAYGVALKTKP